jgi:hypothetical protein
MRTNVNIAQIYDELSEHYHFRMRVAFINLSLRQKQNRPSITCVNQIGCAVRFLASVTFEGVSEKVFPGS